MERSKMNVFVVEETVEDVTTCDGVFTTHEKAVEYVKRQPHFKDMRDMGVKPNWCWKKRPCGEEFGYYIREMTLDEGA